MLQTKEQANKILLSFFMAFFCVTYITTSMYNSITISGFGLIFQLGTFIFMFGKSGLDIIQEFWGRNERKNITLIAMVLRIFFFIITVMAFSIGKASDGAKEFMSEFLRLMIAGEVSLFVGQYFLDPWVYSQLARIMKGRYPSIRGLVSNMIGSVLMTAPYAYIAWWGIKPENEVYKMAFGKIAGKLPTLAIASIVTAFIIFLMRKLLDMRSMVETGGVDHN